jgi:hypothetical protein
MRVACAIACLLAGFTYIACSANPNAPSATSHLAPGSAVAHTDNHYAAAEDKGYIDGCLGGLAFHQAGDSRLESRPLGEGSAPLRFQRAPSRAATGDRSSPSSERI